MFANNVIFPKKSQDIAPHTSVVRYENYGFIYGVGRCERM